MLGVGVLAAFVVPGLTAAGIVGLASVADVPPPLALLAAVVAYVPLASVVAYALARALERSAELRVPWGLVAIGAEGVRWDGWVRRNLTPWRDVRAILTEGDAVVLVTHAGARIVLATSEPAFLREAVRAARAAYESTRRAEIPDVLRGEGETERWITRACSACATRASTTTSPACSTICSTSASSPPAGRASLGARERGRDRATFALDA